MKKCLVALFLIIITACNTNKKETKEVVGFVINGEVDGIPDQKVYLKLVVSEDMSVQQFDPVEIVNGKFKFEGKLINPPALVVFSFEDDSLNVWTQFVMDNCTMSLSIKQKEKEGETFIESELTGSVVNDQYEVYGNGLKEINKETMFFAADYRKLGDNGKLPKEEWSAEDLAVVKKIESKSKEAELARNEYLLKTVSSNNELKKIFALPMLYHWSIPPFNTPKQCDSVFKSLDASLNLSHLRQYYYNEILRKAEYTRLKAEVTVGNSYKDFTLNDQNGKPVKASEVLKKNKYMLLDFWASWCGPCRKENPNVLKVYTKYKEKGFDVLAVSIDDNKDSWLKAIKDDNMPWTQVSDLKGRDNLAAKLYSVSGIPASFLINSEGLIVAIDLRGEELDKKLEELFKN
ncbi:AhpC/TSA family protein [Cellulophaga sp. 20_2_10]|uniref:TlpA disulfide reductase family protein n=1 Tax=Cellulophaga sp. 20_2_10 TaxID=2942476 RepID=UPI00201A8B51|nr:TlpA disulfide reductase family protein [Cellulophaga sp. 20_2_10]MCL5247201.1 AhpC/TSA family protein [Cellulophaga sp. 20_2_10]